MATTNGLFFNVYKVYFYQFDSPIHVSIGVVRAGPQNQGVGTIFQVKGNPCEGMEYERRDNYDFGMSRTFTKQELQFRISARFFASFEHIASTNPPPHDPTAPAPLNPNIPTRGCVTWVDEVLKKILTVVQSGNPIA